MLDPRHLATLETVVRTGSMAAAAQQLGFTQSAISQQIAELERRVGLRVLERRPVRPTEAGHALLAAAGKISTVLATARTELEAIRAGRAGQIRLAAFASAGGSIVPLALARFRAAHPEVILTLTQLEPEDSYARLTRGELDLALTLDYDRAPLPAPSSLRRTLVARDPVDVALPGGHPLAAETTVDLSRLATEDWIASPRAGLRLELLAELARAAGFAPKVRFEGDDFQTVLGLVANGLGIALLPRRALTPPPPDIVTRPLTGRPLTRLLYTARLDTRHAPRAIDALATSLADTAAYQGR